MKTALTQTELFVTIFYYKDIMQKTLFPVKMYVPQSD